MLEQLAEQIRFQADDGLLGALGELENLRTSAVQVAQEEKKAGRRDQAAYCFAQAEFLGLAADLAAKILMRPRPIRLQGSWSSAVCWQTSRFTAAHRHTATILFRCLCRETATSCPQRPQTWAVIKAFFRDPRTTVVPAELLERARKLFRDERWNFADRS